MQSYLLQDWVTIRASMVGGTNLLQAPEAWLDLGDATECTFFLQIAQVNGPGTPIIRYESSATRDATLFRENASRTLVATGDLTPQIDRIALYGTPATPLARWVRWRLTNVSELLWDVTFKVTVMAYPR